MIDWQAFWQKKTLVNYALLPLSVLFYTMSIVRRKLYQVGLLKSDKAQRPVIVIGNINVGGAGKTPLVIGLGKLLADNGVNYAVVSKGYGGNFQFPTVVEHDSLANVVGDEPLLIKLKCNCPVVVAKSRIEACDKVAEQFPDTQVILTDDGLQHYQLARELNICVVNSKIGLGNGFVLPAGGLREPPARLNAMDFVVYNGGVAENHHYLLLERGWYHIHTRKQRYPDEFVYDKNVNLALSGIAHPNLFFERVNNMDIACEKRALPDHHALTQADLPHEKTLLMTEKDWVKAKDLDHDDAWYLATEAVLSSALKADVMQKIQELIE